MNSILLPGLTLIASLAFAVGAVADVVTQPLRKFGLGDLLHVVVSPDGQWMATSGSGGAFLWNFQTGTVQHRLEGHHRRVLRLCFSPDSQVWNRSGQRNRREFHRAGAAGG